MRKSALWLAPLLLAACVESRTADNAKDFEASGIMDGMTAVATDPGRASVVSLSPYGSPDKPFCTGTRIGRKEILTAGHCLMGRTPGLISVTPAIAPDVQASGLRAVIHQVFADGMAKAKNGSLRVTDVHSDFGILFLEDLLPDEVAIAKLQERLLRPGERLEGRIYGYGITAPGAHSSADGTLRTITMQGFVDARRPQMIIFDQKDKKGVCSGDSGGPSFDVSSGEAVLTGVSSYVMSRPWLGLIHWRAACHGESAVSQVASVRPWIDQHLAEARAADKESCLEDENFLKDFLQKSEMDPRQQIYVQGEKRQKDGSRHYRFLGSGSDGNRKMVDVFAKDSCRITLVLPRAVSL